MILEKMLPGEVREIDCHCEKCQHPLIVQVQQLYKNEINVRIRGANETYKKNLFQKTVEKFRRKEVFHDI